MIKELPKVDSHVHLTALGDWPALLEPARRLCAHLDIQEFDFDPERSYLDLSFAPEQKWHAFEELFAIRKKYLKDKIFMRDVYLPHVFEKMVENNVLAAELRVDLIDKLRNKEGNLLFCQDPDRMYKSAAHFATMILQEAHKHGIVVVLIHSINGVKDSLGEISECEECIVRLDDDNIIRAVDLVGHERERLSFDHVLQAAQMLESLPWDLHLGERSRVSHAEHSRYISTMRHGVVRRIAHPIAFDKILKGWPAWLQDLVGMGKCIEFTPYCNMAFGYIQTPKGAVSTFWRLRRDSPNHVLRGSDDPGLLDNPDGITSDAYLVALAEQVELNDILDTTCRNNIRCGHFNREERRVLERTADHRLRQMEAAEAKRQEEVASKFKNLAIDCDVSMAVLSHLPLQLLFLLRKLQEGRYEDVCRLYKQIVTSPVHSLFGKDAVKHVEKDHRWHGWMMDLLDLAMATVRNTEMELALDRPVMAGKILVLRFYLKLGLVGFGPDVTQHVLIQAETDADFQDWYPALHACDKLWLLTALSCAWQHVEYKRHPPGDEARFWHYQQLVVFRDPTSVASLDTAALAHMLANFCSRTASLVFCCLRSKRDGNADETFHHCFDEPSGQRVTSLDTSGWAKTMSPSEPNDNDKMAGVVEIIEWLRACSLCERSHLKACKAYFAASILYMLAGKHDEQMLMFAGTKLYVSQLKKDFDEQPCNTNQARFRALEHDFCTWLRKLHTKLTDNELHGMADGVAKAKLLQAEGRKEELEQMLERNPYHLYRREMRSVASR